MAREIITMFGMIVFLVLAIITFFASFYVLIFAKKIDIFYRVLIFAAGLFISYYFGAISDRIRERPQSNVYTTRQTYENGRLISESKNRPYDRRPYENRSYNRRPYENRSYNGRPPIQTRNRFAQPRVYNY